MKLYSSEMENELKKRYRVLTESCSGGYLYEGDSIGVIPMYSSVIINHQPWRYYKRYR